MESGGSRTRRVGPDNSTTLGSVLEFVQRPEVLPLALALLVDGGPQHPACLEASVVGVGEGDAGYGCDVYIEGTGAGAGVLQGLQMIRKLGTFVEFSVHAGPVAADRSIIGDQKELNVHGAHLGPYCYPRAIQYIAEGTVAAHRIVTHALPLERFQEAIELAHSQTQSVKMDLIP
jgi:threonine dehydrogenase-like Zn-dependent dehydrogenase